MEEAQLQIPVDRTAAAASASLAELIALHAALPDHRNALEVDFLQLFPDRSGSERATHLLHPYPAKLVRNIPRFFLNCEKIAPPGSRILDPFCGSGTVLLEARLHGHSVIGADANPLARIITLAKLSPPAPEQARRQLSSIMSIATKAGGITPGVVNLEYWFSERVRDQLSKLYESITTTCGSAFENPFMWACFSSCVRRVSLADPRLSVPVRINPDRAKHYGAKGDQVLQRLERLKSVEVLQVFWQIALANIKRVERTQFPPSTPQPILFDDARHLQLEPASVDLIMTSPPYVGAQKYVRASSLCLGWLGLSPNGKLRPIERKSIGREHLDAHEASQSLQTGTASIDKLLTEISEKNLSRARIAYTYICEMRDALAESARVLRPGGKMVLVAGPNIVAGLEFDTPRFLAELAAAVNLKADLHLIDTIASRGLMTKRNKTAGTIPQESVYLLTKHE